MVEARGTALETEGRVIGVVGACGGAGASVVAAAVAHGLRRAGERTTLVDLDAQAPGIEMMLGTEDAAGARWPDLVAARGEVDGVSLVAALPRWGVVPVLSGTREPGPPQDDVVIDVCTGLVRCGETVVLDLPRPGAWGATTRTSDGSGYGRAVQALVAGSDVMLLVVPLRLPAAAGAATARDALLAAGAADVRVVVRGPAPGRVDPDDLSAVLGLPVAAVLGRDGWLASAVERGDGPPMGRRSVLGRFALELAGVL